MILTSTNTRMTTPSRTGMLERSRRTMNWIIGTDLGSGGLSDQQIGKGARADGPRPLFVAFVTATGSARCRRGRRRRNVVEVATPQAGPVFEDTGVALVKRMIDVPLDREGQQDVL